MAIISNKHKHHAEAIAAMYIWPEEFFAYGKSAVEFYNQLDDTKKIRCRELVTATRSIDQRAEPVREVIE